MTLLCARRSWLEGHQNSDGGWGEDLRSYRDYSQRAAGRPRRPRRLGLLALLAQVSAPKLLTTVWRTSSHPARGRLVDEPFFRDRFPGDFYINYHFTVLCSGHGLGVS